MFENPHQVGILRYWDGVLRHPGALRQGGGGALGLADGRVEAGDGAGRWRARGAESPTGGFWTPSMAYDSVRGHVVQQCTEEGVWEWDGVGWREAPVEDPEGDGGPGGCNGALFHHRRGRLVVSLGVGSPTSWWEWDGRSWAAQSCASEVWPGAPARGAWSKVYDRARGRILLFGAADADDMEGQTWDWDWKGCTWRRLQPEDPEGDGNPAPRSGHSLV